MSATMQYMFETNDPRTWNKGDGAGLPRPKIEASKPKSEPENIVLNYGDGTSVTDEDDTGSLTQEAFLDGRVAFDAVQDRFSWISERGLTTELLDKESRLEKMEDGLANATIKGKALRSQLRAGRIDNGTFREFVVKFRAQRAEVQEFAAAIDKSIADTEELGTDADLPTTGQALEGYLRVYIDKMPLGTLAVAMDTVEALKASGDITWWEYLTCGLAISYRLARATKKSAGWWDVCERLKAHKKTHFSQVKALSSEDKISGRVGIANLEERLDVVLSVEALSERFGATPAEILTSWDLDDSDDESDSSGTSVWEAMVAAAVWSN